MLTCFEPGGLLWLLSGKTYEQQKPKRLGAEQRLTELYADPTRSNEFSQENGRCPERLSWGLLL
jgi:hypothetical protein